MAADNIVVAARPLVAVTGDVVSALAVADEVTFGQVTNTPLVSAARTVAGNPATGVYDILITQITPTFEATLDINGSPGGTGTISADGTAITATLIPGLNLVFAAGLAVSDAAQVVVVAPGTYRITFRDNSSVLEARVGSLAWTPIVNDGTTRQELGGFPGVEWAFSSDVTLGNAATRRGSATLFGGGRVLQVSPDDSAWTRAIILSPTNDNLVPFVQPNGLTAEVTGAAGTLAANTYRYVVTGKRNGNQSLINEDEVLSVTVILDDAVDLSLDTIEGGYTTWNIWRATGAGVGGYALLEADWDFLASPVYTDDGSVTPSGSPPSTGQQEDVYLRIRKVFPEGSGVTERGTALLLWDSF